MWYSYYGGDKSSIGNNIKAARSATGLTQKELASRCDVAEITICQYETNKREPKYEIQPNGCYLSSCGTDGQAQIHGYLNCGSAHRGDSEL